MDSVFFLCPMSGTLFSGGVARRIGHPVVVVLTVVVVVVIVMIVVIVLMVMIELIVLVIVVLLVVIIVTVVIIMTVVIIVTVVMTPILQDITTILTGSCCVTSARTAGTPPVSDLP